MSNLNVDTAFIVGAGFSHHAGLPLTSEFTKAILEAREFRGGPSRIMVDFLSRFIRDSFDHSVKAGARYWPDLEDVFTCVDLSANTGHHLGSSFPPATLRTVRRAMLSRIIRMLDQKYQVARRMKDSDWRKLDYLFMELASRNVGFISMNWDTVIERKLANTREDLLLDYCCDAVAASIPDPPDPYEFPYSKRAFARELKRPRFIRVAALPIDRKKVEKSVPIVKIHGSANWLYCDNCRQIFWFHPDESGKVADQLVREDDLVRIRAILTKRAKVINEAIGKLLLQPQAKCLCSEKVTLGTRIATFSYRKALDFPMFQRSWLAAEELLRSARRWVFIGYSLPPADYEFKYLLKRTQLSRSKGPEFFVVSGGKEADVRRTYDNYQKFFGRSVGASNFFSHGLTHDAIAAMSR